MDFYFGPAVLLLDGEVFDVMAFIDSARGKGVEDWGGYVETGMYGDVLAFHAVDPDEVYIRVPGINARDIRVEFTDGFGFGFTGLGVTPLPLPTTEAFWWADSRRRPTESP